MTLPITRQLLKPIASPTRKIIQIGRRVQLTQLAARAPLQIRMNILHPSAREQARRSSIGKAPDHDRMIAKRRLRAYEATIFNFWFM
ncbi:MAG: hypothetical protein WAS21_09735 [Geminicoccaceae bacterium]